MCSWKWTWSFYSRTELVRTLTLQVYVMRTLRATVSWKSPLQFWECEFLELNPSLDIWQDTKWVQPHFVERLALTWGEAQSTSPPGGTWRRCTASVAMDTRLKAFSPNHILTVTVLDENVAAWETLLAGCCCKDAQKSERVERIRALYLTKQCFQVIKEKRARQRPRQMLSKPTKQLEERVSRKAEASGHQKPAGWQHHITELSLYSIVYQHYLFSR